MGVDPTGIERLLQDGR